MIKIEKNGTNDCKMFMSQQEAFRNEVIKFFQQAHETIRKSLNRMHEIFLDTCKEVHHEWKQLVNTTNERIEKSLQYATKQSLLSLLHAINGGVGRNEFEIIFQIWIVLENNSVVCQPSLIDVTNTINIVAKELMGTVNYFPLLSDQIDLVCEKKSLDLGISTFYQQISSSDEVLKVVVQIMNGVKTATLSIRDAISKWDVYKRLWNLDMDSFFRRYENSPCVVETFEKDISSHKAEQAIIEKENSQETIQFMRVNFSLLKSCLTKHSTRFQKRLTGIMNKNANRQLQDIHKIFDENSKKLSSEPRSIPALKAMMDCVSEMRDKIDWLEKSFPQVESAYRMLTNYDVDICDHEHELLEKLRPKYRNFSESLTQAESMIKMKKNEMRKVLDESISTQEENSKQMREKIVIGMRLLTSEIPIDKASSQLEMLNRQIKSWKDEGEQLRPGLELFSVDLPEDKILKESEREFHLIDNVCNSPPFATALIRSVFKSIDPVEPPLLRRYIATCSCLCLCASSRGEPPHLSDLFTGELNFSTSNLTTSK